MSVAALVLAVLALGVLVGALLLLRRVDAAVTTMILRCDEERARLARLRAEAAAAAAAAAELAAVEEVVDAGASGVRDVHRAIADIPFDVLGALPATRAASGRVREVHDRTTDGVYDAIFAVGRTAGGVLKALRRRREP